MCCCTAESVFDRRGDLHRVEADGAAVCADDLQIERRIIAQRFMLVAVDDVVFGDIVVSGLHQANFDDVLDSLDSQRGAFRGEHMQIIDDKVGNLFDGRLQFRL